MRTRGDRQILQARSLSSTRVPKPLLWPVLCHSLSKERYAGAELVDSIDPVFDADPTGEVDAFELGEDGVVVVKALADLAVAEALDFLGMAISPSHRNRAAGPGRASTFCHWR